MSQKWQAARKSAATAIFENWAGSRQSTANLPEPERLQAATDSLLELAQMMDTAGIHDRASVIRAEVRSINSPERNKVYESQLE